jgi:hypothetical protein
MFVSVLFFCVLAPCRLVKHTASEVQPWRWRQYFSPKRSYLPTSLHSVKIQKYVDILTAGRTSNITCVCIFLLLHAVYMPRPSYPSRCEHPNNVWWCTQLCNFFHLTLTSSILGPNILLRTCSKTSPVYVLPFRERSISCLSETTGKIKMFCVLIFWFLNIWRETRFWIE